MDEYCEGGARAQSSRLDYHLDVLAVFFTFLSFYDAVEGFELSNCDPGK